MKEIRISMTVKEYDNLKTEASRLGVSVKNLLRDRIFGVDTEAAPTNSAKIIADEVAAFREMLNIIIRSEASSKISLYDENVISMEETMRKIEEMVASYISKTIKEVKKNGGN